MGRSGCEGGWEWGSGSEGCEQVSEGLGVRE